MDGKVALVRSSRAWARGSGKEPSLLLSLLPSLLPPPSPLRRRRAKGEGGATELAVNRHGTAAGRRWGFTRRAGAHSTARGGKTSPDGKMTDINRRFKDQSAARSLARRVSPVRSRCVHADVSAVVLRCQSHDFTGR